MIVREEMVVSVKRWCSSVVARIAVNMFFVWSNLLAQHHVGVPRASWLLLFEEWRLMFCVSIVKPKIALKLAARHGKRGIGSRVCRPRGVSVGVAFGTELVSLSWVMVKLASKHSILCVTLACWSVG